jgi:hypothetical protein
MIFKNNETFARQQLSSSSLSPNHRDWCRRIGGGGQGYIGRRNGCLATSGVGGSRSD